MVTSLLFINNSAVSHLWLVAAQNLVGLHQVQFPVALFEHVDAWKPSSGGHKGLFNAGGVDDVASVQYPAC